MSQPGRHANVYVFAWHGETQETADQRDPTTREFYVVPECELPPQKSIGLNIIRNLRSLCDIAGLGGAVHEALKPGPHHGSKPREVDRQASPSPDLRR